MLRLPVLAIVACLGLSACGADEPEKVCVERVATGPVLMGKFGGYRETYRCDRWEYRCPAPTVVSGADGLRCRLPKAP